MIFPLASTYKKPENVLLSGPDHNTATLKLADFGQSKVLSTQGKATVSSPGLTGGVGELSLFREDRERSAL
jgi:serine/threonine protein kinase